MQFEQTGANIWIYNGVVVQLYGVMCFTWRVHDG